MLRLASVLLILFVLVHSSSQALGCTCPFTSLSRVYFSRDTTWYVRARVTKVVLITEPSTRIPRTRVYALRIQGVYKGCLRRNRVVVTSPWSGGACGVSLRRGVSYVLPLRRGRNPMVFLCDFIARFKDLSRAQRDFLDDRTNCCGGKCRCGADRPPVFCRKRLCAGRKPCRSARKCVASLCACRSEWFGKDGLPACESTAFP